MFKLKKYALKKILGKNSIGKELEEFPKFCFVFKGSRLIARPFSRDLTLFENEI